MATPAQATKYNELGGRVDVLMLCAIAALIGLGIVMVASSSMSYAVMTGQGAFYYFNRHLMFLAIGLAMAAVALRTEIKQIEKYGYIFLLLCFLALLSVWITGLGKSVNGARRWLHVGVTRIQPSELMKIALPLMLAWWFQKREGQLRPLDFLAAIFFLALPVGLIMKQPDLGTSLLVLAAGLAVIFFAGLSWRLIVPPVLLGLVGVALLVWYEPQLCADGMRWPVLHDYQQQRICTLLDPSRDLLGKGFHIIQGMIAIGSGGFFGKGFMQGTQSRLNFLPEKCAI